MKNIAIIGSGISGLTSAYLLSQKHNITVFEKNDYIGGHTATKTIEYDGERHAIDTGFIVCNDKTYPNFLKLLSQLDVKRHATEMSFSVFNKRNGLEYNGADLNKLFAQRRNILNPKFWRLISEILRFNKQCKALYSNQDVNGNSLNGQDIDTNATLADFLKDNNFSDYFAQHYILPMGAAIWSTSLDGMKAFQLRFFIQFFHHHGLLNITDRPQWYAIKGGSKEYIAPLTKNFKDNIELSSTITKVSRDNSASGNNVTISFEDGTTRLFDEVIFACHSDQALGLLADASDKETEILSAIPYSENEVVLHTDISLLPKRKLAWASWNYLLHGCPKSENSRPSAVTYNMNILQGIQSKHTFCVTLNQTALIDKAKILAKYRYHHPVFNHKSLAAQQRRSEICGKNNTHFAGAYWHNGFHEDGVVSALYVAEKFGLSL